ncbi:MAG: ImmA/IrrE family metallo-endopeptidase [Opitutae bacterium]|nr:ImmA/IrrE family metallo-endopeptidase [Opitutae bacterium]
MPTVPVKPELIRWARDRAGLTVAALVERFPRYERWESGEGLPTLHQLEELAKATHAPLGYFFLPEPPTERLPVPDFRTVQDRPVRRPSPDLIETIQIMQRRQSWLRDHLLEEEQPPLPFVGSATVQENPEAVAARVRQQLGLAPDWARHYPTWTEALRGLRQASEAAGVVVTINGVVGNSTRRKLDPEEFRGFVLSDPHAPVVFVNGSDAKAAQMFTLVHELAHLWLGQGGVFSLPGMQPADYAAEIWCNRLAAEFLVPASELSALWPAADVTAEPFQFLARRFKVSPLVTARRALDLRLIGREGFLSFYRHYLEDDRRQAARRSPGGDFYLTQEVRIGRRFGEAVVRAAKEGRLLFTEAYRLTGLYGATFDQYAEALSGRPRP